jgi:hypothetical protein
MAEPLPGNGAGIADGRRKSCSTGNLVEELPARVDPRIGDAASPTVIGESGVGPLEEGSLEESWIQAGDLVKSGGSSLAMGLEKDDRCRNRDVQGSDETLHRYGDELVGCRQGVPGQTALFLAKQNGHALGKVDLTIVDGMGCEVCCEETESVSVKVLGGFLESPVDVHPHPFVGAAGADEGSAQCSIGDNGVGFAQTHSVRGSQHRGEVVRLVDVLEQNREVRLASLEDLTKASESFRIHRAPLSGEE